MAGATIVVASPRLVVTPILMMKMMEMEVAAVEAEVEAKVAAVEAEVVLEGDVGGVVVVPGPTSRPSVG